MMSTPAASVPAVFGTASGCTSGVPNTTPVDPTPALAPSTISCPSAAPKHWANSGLVIWAMADSTGVDDANTATRDPASMAGPLEGPANTGEPPGRWGGPLLPKIRSFEPETPTHCSYRRAMAWTPAVGPASTPDPGPATRRCCPAGHPAAPPSTP